MKRTVTVLVNNLDGVFQKSVFAGAAEVMSANSLELRAVPVGEMNEERVREEVRAVAQGSKGVLVLANAVEDAELSLLAGAGVPVMLVSHRDARGELPTIMFDNAQGLEQLVSHVVKECGRRELIYLGGDPSQLDAKERERAFLIEALRHDTRVPQERLLSGDFTPRVAGEALAAYLQYGGGFDAVVAADFLMAIAAKEALDAAGVRVPEEVAVVGFGDGPEAEEAGVTTVAADVVELGRRGARQLVAQLSGARLTGRTLLSTHLVTRSSSCP